VNANLRPQATSTSMKTLLPLPARGLLHRIFVAFLLVLGPSAHAADRSASDQIVHDDPFTGFRFPKNITGYVFQNKIQYPRVALGYGLNYVERMGATATIMIYDLNTSGIPDGTTDAGVRQQYEEIDASMAAFAKQGGYRAVRRVEGVPPLSKAWLQANHELARPDGRPAFSYTFIRAQNGKYVKIRVTTPSAASYARLPLFLLGVSRAIGMMSGQGRPSE
jgi:hypothetical protein